MTKLHVGLGFIELVTCYVGWYEALMSRNVFPLIKCKVTFKCKNVGAETEAHFVLPS